MPDFWRTLGAVLSLAIGSMLIAANSMAAAAILILLADLLERTKGVAAAMFGNMSEYVLLHQARNAVVPNHMRIDLDSSAQRRAS